jgi:prevent-host-death family protein
MEVSVREVKNRLSEYLRRAQAGEEIAILSRGRPVGRLLPPRPGAGTTDDEALARLKALPGIRPGNGERVRGSDRPVSVPPETTEAILHWVRGE